MCCLPNMVPLDLAELAERKEEKAKKTKAKSPL
jgi:hypothetical protein